MRTHTEVGTLLHHEGLSTAKKIYYIFQLNTDAKNAFLVLSRLHYLAHVPQGLTPHQRQWGWDHMRMEVWLLGLCTCSVWPQVSCFSDAVDNQSPLKQFVNSLLWDNDILSPLCCRASVTCVSIHPSGKLALSVSKDRTVRFEETWNGVLVFLSLFCLFLVNRTWNLLTGCIAFTQRQPRTQGIYMHVNCFIYTERKPPFGSKISLNDFLGDKPPNIFLIPAE